MFYGNRDLLSRTENLVDFRITEIKDMILSNCLTRFFLSIAPRSERGISYTDYLPAQVLPEISRFHYGQYSNAGRISGRKHKAKWFAFGSFAIFLLSTSNPAKSSAATDRSSYSPRAIELIQEMADSYAALTVLEQKTVYHSSMVPIDAAFASGNTIKSENGKDESLLPRTSKIAFQAPNLIAVETRENGDHDTAGMEKWISDGVNFFSYQQAKNTYTKEKAPGRLRDFYKLANMTTGLELMMMMGNNPFKDIKNLVQSVEMEDNISKNRSSTDNILMKMTSQYETTNVRLTLDAETHLLLRLSIEKIPIAAAPDEEKHVLGDALDELDTEAAPKKSTDLQTPPDVQQAKMKTLFTYENTITTNPQFKLTTFQFLIPRDALQFDRFDPSGKLQKKRLEEQLASLLKERGIKHPKIFK